MTTPPAGSDRAAASVASPTTSRRTTVGFGGDLARVERIVGGYRRHVRPEPEELARLDTLIATRPIVFEAWSFATGRHR